MLCPNCEAENREGAQFCDECGFPLSGSLARMGASPAASAAVPMRDEQPPARDLPDQYYIDAFDEPEDDVPGDSEPFAPENDYRTPSEPQDHAGGAPEREPVATQAVATAEAANAPDRAAATIAFDVEPTRAPEQAPTYEEQDDPFAGYSQSIDEREFGFMATPAEGAAAPYDDGWGSHHTMEMPRLDGEPRSRARDFRIASPTRRQGRSKIAIVIAAGIVAGIAVAALVTYLLGFWGGVSVPDVTGMTESDARAVLEDNGFTVRSTQIKSDDTEGLVVVMDPEGGSRASEGSEVVIHISTARFVPDIAGKTQEEAQALLADSGYENVRFEKVKSEDTEGIVLSVNPEAGTRAKSNAEIVVSVSEAYRVPDISGLDLEAAEQAIADAGLVFGVAYVDTDQYEDGTIIGTDPEQGTKVDKDSYVSINVARKRGAELVALTEGMFAQGSTVTIGGVDYEVQSLDAVSYEGDDVVSFTMTGLPRTTFFGKTIYADAQVVSGQIAYSESNEVLSIS